MTLGIGIITYNRQLLLRGCLDQVQAFTKSPHYLVVAEDGGTDGTAEYCKQRDVTTITGTNKGVCWNKNRALYCLASIGADPILLLEDDCWPNKEAWEQSWIKAATLWHHVNYVHPDWPANWCRGGKGTAEQPWRSWELTGQATVTSMSALNNVGYLDTQFIGYGYGHIEWTTRFCISGLINRNLTPCLNIGLQLQQSNTFRKPEQVIRNQHLFKKLQIKPFTYCHPWQNQVEKEQLLTEVSDALQQTPMHMVS